MLVWKKKRGKFKNISVTFFIIIFYIAQEKYLPQLVTQTKLKRTKTPNKNGQRSKYIIRPEYALMVGNHVVWTLVKGEFLALAATKKKIEMHRLSRCASLGKTNILQIE